MKTQERKRTKRNLMIFTILVLGLATSAGFIEPLIFQPEGEPNTPGLGQLLWFLSPFVVSLLLRIFGGDGWRDFGLKPNFKGNGFWWLVSVMVFPIVIVLTLILGVLLGGLRLDGIMVPTFVGVLLSGLISAMVKNIFEEFAWRGYLAPKVYSLELNIWLSHCIVGLIWGAWHLPFVMALWPYLTPEMLWYFVPLLFLGTISQSVVYGEIRLATSSVVPAWLMHSIGNAFGNAFLLSGCLQFVLGRELLFTPGAEGVLSIVLMSVLGYWLHQRRRH